MCYIIYLINNFDLKKSEIYEKIIIFDQGDKWAKGMKQ